MSENDEAWKLINEVLREGWCTSPCAYRDGCGCADGLQAVLTSVRLAVYEDAAKIAEKEASDPEYCACGQIVAAAIRSRAKEKHDAHG